MGNKIPFPLNSDLEDKEKKHPTDVISYVHDMLTALAALADQEGDFRLANAIRNISKGSTPLKDPRH